MTEQRRDQDRPVDLTGAVGVSSEEALGTSDVPDTGGTHDGGSDIDEGQDGGHLGETAIAQTGG